MIRNKGLKAKLVNGKRRVYFFFRLVVINAYLGRPPAHHIRLFYEAISGIERCIKL